MKKIGIMGGTFNPIHIGHIEIAKAAFSQYVLDEVWFMPNHIPSYKQEDYIVSKEHRFNMVQLAIKDFPHFKASDFELKREGNTYTIETLKLLKQQYPDDSFYFIMGSDSLFSFEKWKCADLIPQYATLLVAPRDEKSNVQINRRINELNNLYNGTPFQVLKCDKIPCSSSKIREWFQNRNYDTPYKKDNVGEHIFISKEVYEYIMANGLYCDKK